MGNVGQGSFDVVLLVFVRMYHHDYVVPVRHIVNLEKHRIIGGCALKGLYVESQFPITLECSLVGTENSLQCIWIEAGGRKGGWHKERDDPLGMAFPQIPHLN